MASASADEAPPPPQTSRTLTIEDLPQETLKAIITHCAQGDLICLSLVSKHFRELAAAQLYRNFHIVFPDEDDPAYDSPIDGLAGGLDTFVTSDYDYSKHLKDLSLDTLSTGPKAEAAYKPYLFSVSCGKFMNTLLLLTLRKARTLETFRWNIRVELGRPVYAALHKITTLSHVHIRLQSGPSLYEAPPPLPYSPAAASSAVVHHMPETAPPPLPPPPGFPMGLAPPSLFYTPQTGVPPPPLPKPPVKIKAPPKRSSSFKEPPTFSGFKNLKTLAVLDIDTLDVVAEIKKCVRNSTGTLTKLKLSLSEPLACQARKPPPDLDPDESDAEEFQVVPVPSNPGATYLEEVSGPAKVHRAQEERKNQEAILGRIFDVEPYLVKRPKKRPCDKEKDTKDDSGAGPGRDFINAIRAVSNKIMKDLNGTSDFTQQQQETLDIIETAARKFVEAEDAKRKEEAKPADKEGQGNSTAAAAETAQDAESSEQQLSGSAELFASSPAVKAKDVGDKDVSPDDINIEEPEGLLVIEPPEASGAKDGSSSEAAPSEADAVAESSSSMLTPSSTPAPSQTSDAAPVPPIIGNVIQNLATQKTNFRTLTEKLLSFEDQAVRLGDEIETLRDEDDFVMERIESAELRMQRLSENIQDIQKEMLMVEVEIEDAERQIPKPMAEAAMGDSIEASRRLVSDYVRTTRGLPLKTLSIYLLPVKPSVLSRAIDIRALRSITLLNVGPQAPIWVMFTKENKLEPLGLRKIFTDNVSTIFLNFVAQLDEVHDLFMLEREIKYKPEPFTSKTSVTMEQIRNLVLKKHIHTLRRLMIKNMSGLEWDADEKTTLLISRKGRLLQELAVSMNIRSIHTLMQHLGGLVSLRALHIVRLRNEDTCVWVMRECKRFLVDNLVHHPTLKLEWISIDEENLAERIVRPSDGPKKVKTKSKGKEKATHVPNGVANGAFPVLHLDAWGSIGDESDIDDDDDDEDLDPQKLETMEGVLFSDVWGVKIFKKEITSGRL